MKNKVKVLFVSLLTILLTISIFSIFFIPKVKGVTLTPDGDDYIFDNDIIKVRITDNTVIKITNDILNREVAYGYFFFSYRVTPYADITSFYFNDIGNWDLEPIIENDTHVSLGCSKQYIDTISVTHNFYLVLMLNNNDNMISVGLLESANANMTQIGLTFESNFYPQGYANQTQNTANLNVGNNTDYSTPLPCDNEMYVYTSAGNITYGEPSISLDSYADIDSYLISSNGTSIFGVMSPYVDLRNLRFRSLNYGDERQFMWFDVNLRNYDRTVGWVQLYIGVWDSINNAVSDWNNLVYVEELIESPTVEFLQCVRTDLNIHLYEYNTMFPDILDNILARQDYSMVSGASPATLIPAGTVEYTFFKYRNYPEIWGNTSQDTQEDFVQKSINFARVKDVILDVEIDITAPLWIVNNPNDGAIGINGLPYENAYWVKMPLLVESGEEFHDTFISMVTYLLQNYNFRALVLSECMYKETDYSNETKAKFLSYYPQYGDFPKLANGTIDIYNEDLMKFKVDYLSIFWDELEDLAHTYDRKFYVMVEPNFLNPSLQGAEYGQNYTSVIQHCDGLWVWAYYGYFGVNPNVGFANLAEYLIPLSVANETKDIILSIGLWRNSGSISAGELGLGLYYLDQTFKWFDGIEVTPSKYMTTSEYWEQLWHGSFSVEEEDFTYMLVDFIVLFLVLLAPAMILAFEFVRRGADGAYGLIAGLCLTVPVAYIVHLIDLWCLFVIALGIILMVITKLAPSVFRGGV